MKRKNIIFIIILVATVILGAVAVVTALKLREIGQEPVAPTAPTSIPRAAEPEPTVDPACVKEFTVSEGLACVEVEMTPDDATVEAGDERDLEAIVTGGTPPYTYEWTVDTEADPGSLSGTTDNPTTWTAPSELTEEAEWTLEALITDAEEDYVTCSAVLSFSPTVELECWDACMTDSDCPSDLSCQDVDGTDRCVNSDCPEESDCVCPGETPTPSPTPTESPTPAPTPAPTPSPTPAAELPEAGIISPTIFAGIAGMLLIVLGILL